MFVELGNRYSVISPVLLFMRVTRSVIIEPVQASPFLSTATSYGLLHAVGTTHSRIALVFGSYMPTALPSYSANHRRFCSSTRPRRGRERRMLVLCTSSFLVAPSRMPILLPLKSSIYSLLSRSALIP